MNYHVIASYVKRSQKESASPALEEKYPQGYWWRTGAGLYEFRVEEV